MRIARVAQGRGLGQQRVDGERQHEDDAGLLGQRQQRQHEAERERLRGQAAGPQRQAQRDDEDDRHQALAPDAVQRQRERRADRDRERRGHAQAPALDVAREQPLDADHERDEERDRHQLDRARLQPEEPEAGEVDQVHQRRMDALAVDALDQPREAVAVDQRRAAEADQRVQVRRLADEAPELHHEPGEHEARPRPTYSRESSTTGRAARAVRLPPRRAPRSQD